MAVALCDNTAYIFPHSCPPLPSPAPTDHVHDLPPAGRPVCRWLPAAPRLPHQPLVLETFHALLGHSHDGGGADDSLGLHQRTDLRYCEGGGEECAVVSEGWGWEECGVVSEGWGWEECGVVSEGWG